MYSAQPSFWEKSTFLADIDIAIIGAGLVGTSAAIYAQKKYPKAKIVVFDRGFIASGASTKNAGFACFGSISELLDDLEDSEPDAVFSLMARRYEGLTHLLELLDPNRIDYKACGGFELFRDIDQSFAQKCIDRIEFFNKETEHITGLTETYRLDKAKLSAANFENTNMCIANVAEGQLHPGKMMQALYEQAKEIGVLFYHGIEISQVEDQSNHAQLELANGWTIKVNQVLIANNGFAQKMISDLPIKAVRNQVLVTSKIPNLSVEGTFHMHKGYFYFRNVDSRILIGGGRHLDLEHETTDQFGSNSLIEDALQALLTDVILPGTSFTIEDRWSGILGVGPSKLPILKKQSEHITLAVRLGGMGVALGSLLGKEAAQLI